MQALLYKFVNTLLAICDMFLKNMCDMQSYNMPNNFHFTIQKDWLCSLHLYANKLQLEFKEQLAKT